MGQEEGSVRVRPWDRMTDNTVKKYLRLSFLAAIGSNNKYSDFLANSENLAV